MIRKGEGSKQFNPEQKKSAVEEEKPVQLSSEVKNRLTKELFLPKTLAYIKNVTHKLSPGIQEADRDDIVQETLITMNRNIQNSNFDESRASLTSYLFQIIRSRLTDLHRKKQNHPTLELDKFTITDPKTPTENWIEKAYMAGMVSQLSTTEQQIVKLRSENYTNKEVAEKLKIPIGTVESTYFRAIKKLQKIAAKDAEKNKL